MTTARKRRTPSGRLFTLPIAPEHAGNPPSKRRGRKSKWTLLGMSRGQYLAAFNLPRNSEALRAKRRRQERLLAWLYRIERLQAKYERDYLHRKLPPNQLAERLTDEQAMLEDFKVQLISQGDTYPWTEQHSAYVTPCEFTRPVVTAEKAQAAASALVRADVRSQCAQLSKLRDIRRRAQRRKDLARERLKRWQEARRSKPTSA